MVINPQNIVCLLKQEFEECPLTLVNDLEKELVSYIKDIIFQAMNHSQTVVDVVSDLVVNSPSEINTYVGLYDPEADDIEYQIDPLSTPSAKEDVPFDYKQRAVQFWKTGDARSRTSQRKSFSSVQHKFRKVKHRENLYRWEKQVDAGGTHRLKLQKISETVFKKFMEMKKRHRTIHDLDIRKWALATAKDLNCANFKASPSWLLNFKRAHRIVSRKITKFVSNTDTQDKEAIENAAIAFQLEITPMVEALGSTNVFNADQSGFQYELHSGRTLEIAGERKVERIVQSKNATTHSFTVMPTMSADGDLISPLYIVLQEPSGNFGPQVMQNMCRPPNLFISCSKSGKMGKEHLQEWVKDVFIPKTNHESLLIVDSWSKFTEENIRAKISDDKKVIIQQIPAGATGLIQPWDVWGFRLWKNFVRHIEDFVVLHDIDLVLSQRNNTLKLQALVFEQLSSPRYKSVFKYSWYKAGLTATRPDTFKNPVHFAFRGQQIVCDYCDKVHMLNCSWCKAALCVVHFFLEMHICQNYVA